MDLGSAKGGAEVVSAFLIVFIVDKHMLCNSWIDRGSKDYKGMEVITEVNNNSIKLLKS